MTFEHRTELKERARMAKGLVNVLKEDLEDINIEIDEDNLNKLDEATTKTLQTLKMLYNEVMEIEYISYILSNRITKSKWNGES